MIHRSTLFILMLCLASSTVSRAETNLFRRPLIVAHRGFSWEAPENTLAAYRRAIEIGAEMAECDVYLSRDGVPVCIHDSKLDRTTSGTGLVNEKTVAEIQQFDAGTWKGAEFAGERVPTLVELLQLVDGRLRLVIEIKQADIEEHVVAALRQANVAPESVMIFSFNYDTVNKIAKIEPLLPTTWLLAKLPPEPADRDATLRKALRGRVSAIGLGKDHVDPHFVRRAKACGLPVFVWTVNEADTMRTLAAQGVDAIITDRPDLAASVFTTSDATPLP